MILLASRPVFLTAIVFVLFAAALLVLGFGAHPAGSVEQVSDCVAAGIFLLGVALLFWRRRWVHVCCSVLLAVVLGNFAFASIAATRPPPGYSILVLRATVIAIACLLIWLFAAFAFGKSARNYFAKQKHSDKAWFGPRV